MTWSPQAVQDIDGICEFIARDSERYARIVGEGVVAIVETIRDTPLVGWEVLEYGQADLRERLYRNYLIVYRIRGNDIEIVTITHGSRPLPPATL